MIHVLVVGWETTDRSNNLTRAPRRVLALATVEARTTGTRVAVELEIGPSRLILERPESGAGAVDLEILSTTLGGGLGVLVTEATRISRLEPGDETRIDGLPEGSYSVEGGGGTSLPFVATAETVLSVP